MNVLSRTDGAIVETSLGRIRGAMTDGVFSVKGAPYAASTEGAGRFMPPKALEPWTGVQDAFEFGHRAPQNDRAGAPANEWIRSDAPRSEDCLSLNVFTTGAGDAATRPVMVYLHGGGYHAGSGDAPGIDGAILAKKGDVVVVTVNHRLGVFGFCHFDVEGDDSFAESGNVGMLDIVAALEWVRENIGAFGGDASNVTIFGQSGGASKVAVLMTIPVAKGLFHKAIMQSSSSHLHLATKETAAKARHELLAQLDMPGAGPRELQAVPTDRLLAAYTAAVAANHGDDSFRPVVDGRAILNHPFDSAAPDLAADIPLLIGSCETEKSFYDITVDPATLPMTRAQLLQSVQRFIGLDPAAALALVCDYESRRPGISGRDLYNVLTSDHMYRRNDIEAAERKSQAPGAPAYLYEFTWKTPVLGGILKTPHTLCIPFVFGTLAASEAFVGAGATQETLSEKVMGAWLAFARAGDPNHGGLPAWPPFEGKARPTMVFDNDCVLLNDPKPEDRIAINSCPPFISDQQFSGGPAGS
ncbi:MAG: para-nitrobenzyl esterase [Alphaproteobacteria bacterium]|jgi:para-nitrobenzyl esterase